MIRSFKNSVTEEVFNGRCPKGFPPDLLSVARRKLRMVAAAQELRDLKSPPGNKLHPLTKDRAGQHAIWINDQFRVCFEWRNGDAYNVEITDYH
jgi:proteic killer suppression protein